METTTPNDTHPRQTAALDSGDLFGLRTSADRLHQAIAVMLKDWRDGDFELPRLAEIHMGAIEEKYREVGRALRAADEPRMTLPTAAPTHSEIAWYVREVESLREMLIRADAALETLGVGKLAPVRVNIAHTLPSPNVKDEPRRLHE